MKSRYITFALIIIILLMPLLFPSSESRLETWSKALLCPVCQGETIYDSPSEYADDMRSILEKQIDDGLTDSEINEFWVNRYGERIITNPITNNLEILFLPLSIVLIFISIFIRKLYVKK
tara:strand:+ start:2336 stop:2695 length:360 start_codon:yes stop_codon:yes gene_type:complete